MISRPFLRSSFRPFFCYRDLCTRNLLRHLSPHYFSTCVSRHATVKSSSLGAVKAAPSKFRASKLGSPMPAVAGLNERFRAFNDFLSKAKGSVQLFNAPSHRAYVFSAYSTAIFCYVYTGWHLYTSFFDIKVDISRWIKGFFAGMCIVMGAMGTVVLRRGSNLVSAMSAVRSQGQTNVHIKVRRMIPFAKHKELVTTPEEISFSRSVLASPGLDASDRLGSVDQQWRARKEMHMLPFYKAPLKKISFASWSAFMNMRRIITQEYFVYMSLKDQKQTLRVDLTGDFAPVFRDLERGVFSGPRE